MGKKNKKLNCMLDKHCQKSYYLQIKKYILGFKRLSACRGHEGKGTMWCILPSGLKWKRKSITFLMFTFRERQGFREVHVQEKILYQWLWDTHQEHKCTGTTHIQHMWKSNHSSRCMYVVCASRAEIKEKGEWCCAIENVDGAVWSRERLRTSGQRGDMSWASDMDRGRCKTGGWEEKRDRESLYYCTSLDIHHHRCTSLLCFLCGCVPLN